MQNDLGITGGFLRIGKIAEVVSPGIEPGHQVPETCILSFVLRDLFGNYQIFSLPKK